MDVDPTGKWIVAGGKLQPATTVLNFEKMQAAINNKTFEGDFRGIPIVKYEAVVEGEVPVGLGPLHTQYDGKGNAYTSMFIDSNITKWKMPPWTDEEKKDLNKVVLDKMPAHFSTGHLVVAGSDTKNPYGKWLRGDEQAFGRPPVNVGPSQPESSQLIDITGEKMKMVAEAYTEPEPHFAQILKVTEIQPAEVYPKAENKDPNAVWDKEQTGVTRNGNKVVAKVIAIRSRFTPDRIDAQVGDELTVHVTNVEQTRDMIHGFGVDRTQHQHGDGSGRNEDVPHQADEARRVPVLLHELLLGAAPGDAGLSGGEQAGQPDRRRRTGMRADWRRPRQP